MEKQIQKRNGDLVPFDSIKILNAIHRAGLASDDHLTPADLSYLTQKVCDTVEDVEIPTVDGKVKVKIEPGTQPGKVLRLRGKGLPSVNGYGTGDLLVNVSVYIPETLTKEEKKLMEEWDKSESFKPNTSIKEKIFRKFKSLFD